MERKGHLLSAQRDRDGGVTYDREEIDRVAARRRSQRLHATTADAVAAFKMFRTGASLDQVVIDLNLHPRVVRQLRKEFDLGYRDETPEEEQARKRQEAREEEERHLARVDGVDAFLAASRRASAAHDAATPLKEPSKTTPTVHKAKSLDDDPDIQQARAKMAEARERLGLPKKK